MTERAPAAPVAAGGNGTSSAAPPRPDVDRLRRDERTFLSMCLAEPAAGREYLAKLSDDHLSSERLRGVRDWLIEHFDSPLAGLPSDDPSLSAAVTEVVMLAEEEPSSGSVLRLTFLQLELDRVNRALRHAEREGDFDRQRALWGEREQVRARFDEMMGETE